MLVLIFSKTNPFAEKYFNTSGNAKGSQANGDGVFLKKRAYSLVMAVARPDWDAPAPKAATVKATVKKK